MSNQSKKPAVDASQLKQEEKLQAIILLDSYSNKFEPFSLTKPECLLPLVGDKCLLDASVEFLIENEVKELVLFCTRHHTQIKSYVESKKWHKHLEIHFLYNFKCQSVGDAMREIDAKGVVRNTFILLTASSIITNIKLNEHLELHKQTCKNDKNAVMTIMCMNRLSDLSNGLAGSDSSCTDQANTLFVHNINNRVLHYEHVASHHHHQKKSQNHYITIPMQVFENAYSSSKQSSILTQQAVDAANAKFKLQNQAYVNNLTATRGYQGGSIDTVLHLKTI